MPADAESRKVHEEILNRRNKLWTHYDEGEGRKAVNLYRVLNTKGIPRFRELVRAVLAKLDEARPVDHRR